MSVKEPSKLHNATYFGAESSLTWMVEPVKYKVMGDKIKLWLLLKPTSTIPF